MKKDPTLVPPLRGGNYFCTLPWVETLSIIHISLTADAVDII